MEGWNSLWWMDWGEDGVEGGSGPGMGWVQQWQILLNPNPLSGPDPPSPVNKDLSQQYCWCSSG